MKPIDSNLHIRVMTESDIPACQQLKEQLIWNQTIQDWKRFLSYNPTGCFVAEIDGKLIGTVCTIGYEDKFGWVAMVIVDPNFRRKGIGKALLHAGIKHLQDRGLSVKLDATPEGKLLYDSLGFVDEYTAARHTANQPELPEPARPCLPVTPSDWDEIFAIDTQAFGASRTNVLQSYFTLYPQYSFLIKEEGKITGYITARDGSKAFHPGPWVAQNSDAAISLFCSVIKLSPKPIIFVDTIDNNIAINQFLTHHHFSIQRPLIRMVLGKNHSPGKPEWIQGYSGPELG